MKNTLAVGICINLVMMTLGALAIGAEEQITLRLSDWHLTEGVWNKPLKEAMDLFQQQHPSMKVVLEPVTHAEKEAKYLQGFEQHTAPDIICFFVHTGPPVRSANRPDRDVRGTDLSIR